MANPVQHSVPSHQTSSPYFYAAKSKQWKAALASLCLAQYAGSTHKQELCTFAEGALQLLQPVVCSAVSSSIAGHASYVVTLILPPLLEVAEKLGPQPTKELCIMLWATCR